MVPAGETTESTVKEVAEVLEKGDAIIDGGNSYYRDDMRRSEMVGEEGIDYIDWAPAAVSSGSTAAFA